MIEETLASLVERFNRRVDQSPAMQEELHGLDRTATIKLTDGGSYAVDLHDGHLTNLRSRVPSRADLTITTDRETFEGLVKKEIGPMKAIVTRRLTIDGSLDDKLLFRKLLA